MKKDTHLVLSEEVGGKAAEAGPRATQARRPLAPARGHLDGCHVVRLVPADLHRTPEWPLALDRALHGILGMVVGK